ncbi:MAG: hypothetical protein JXB47_12850 [Anaerolineae bacterium]|nr:hypothetical protein [Anaerolineae bacterium]
MQEISYPYRSVPMTTALVITGGTAALAVSLPDAGWRWLILLAAAGPALWLLSEALRRRCAVRLAETELIIEQPLPAFTRVIAYMQIAGFLTTEARQRPAIAYRRPPRQPGLPPRLGLVVFEPLEDEAGFWEAVEQRAPADLPFDAAQVARYVRGRRARRRMLGAAALLLTPFVVILLAQTLRMFS